MTSLPASVDVIVVGGGIVGLATALALAEAGAKPLVLEAKSFGGAVTGGSLAAIGVHMHGLEEYALLTEACGLWRSFSDRSGDAIEHNAQGQVGFCLDDEDIASAETWIAEERALGAPYRMLSGSELRDLEPGLTGPVRAATYAPDTATINPFRAARAVLAAARAAGATAMDHAPVAGLLSAGGKVQGVRMASGQEITGDAVVLAAGPWSQEIAGAEGIYVPLFPRQAQCLAALRQPAGTIRHVVSGVERKGGVDSGYTQIQQAASGQILFNTVMELMDTAPDAKDAVREVPPGFVMSSIDMLVTLFPGLADIALLRSWVRFEAVSPDARFLAGPLERDGLWICAGDNGSGYCRSLMLGRFLAGEITGKPVLDAALRADAARLYAPKRFAGVAA